MKISTIIIGMGLLTGCGEGGEMKETDVPEIVRSKFTELYPQVRDLDWEMEDGMYEAEFDEGRVEISVLIDSLGNFQQTENEIPVSTLPSSILEYVKKNLGDKTIQEAALITEANGSVSYEAEVDNRDYIFDSNGNLLEAEQASENDEKNDDEN